MGIPLDSFAFSLNPISLSFVEGPLAVSGDGIGQWNAASEEDWTFLSLYPRPEYALAVAVHPDTRQGPWFRLREIEAERLVRLCESADLRSRDLPGIG